VTLTKSEATRTKLKATHAQRDCTGTDPDAHVTKVAVSLIKWQATAAFRDVPLAHHDPTGTQQDMTAM
jgi:hypothetical protein